MDDITYCIYSNCPLKECEKHLSKAKTKTVRVADFCGTCREYLGYLLVELEEKKGD